MKPSSSVAVAAITVFGAVGAWIGAGKGLEARLHDTQSQIKELDARVDDLATQTDTPEQSQADLRGSIQAGGYGLGRTSSGSLSGANRVREVVEIPSASVAVITAYAHGNTQGKNGRGYLMAGVTVDGKLCAQDQDYSTAETTLERYSSATCVTRLEEPGRHTLEVNGSGGNMGTISVTLQYALFTE